MDLRSGLDALGHLVGQLDADVGGLVTPSHVRTSIPFRNGSCAGSMQRAWFSSRSTVWIRNC